ncbi:MAG: CPBP family intramembrane metalloprotease [Thermotogae bacterium]|nr:CPBP family intramembrane metalloprotease [Thermotogota bacterium]
MDKLAFLSEILLVAVLWTFAFKGPLNFWIGILMAALVMIAFSLRRGVLGVIRPTPSDVPLGVLYGLLLFAATWLSAVVVREYLPSLYLHVEAVKSLRSLAPPMMYVPVVLTVSTAEEFFWRGTVQRILSLKLGKLPGFLLALALYVGVHVLAGNPALALASAVAGAFWGFLYILHRDLTPVWISHLVWDVLLLVVGI